ncbi:unnamed protein product, partial [marine sediment metagenome]
MFFGVDGPYWTLEDDAIANGGDGDGEFDENEANADAVGVAISNASLALALFSPTNNTGNAIKYIALKATADHLGFVGADVFQIEGSTIAVSLNIATGTGVTSVTPVMNFSGELFGLFDANADGVITVGELRELNGQAADSSTEYGLVGDLLYETTDDQDDEVSLAEVVRILDTSGAGGLSVAE